MPVPISTFREKVISGRKVEEPSLTILLQLYIEDYLTDSWFLIDNYKACGLGMFYTTVNYYLYYTNYKLSINCY